MEDGEPFAKRSRALEEVESISDDVTDSKMLNHFDDVEKEEEKSGESKRASENNHLQKFSSFKFVD